MLELDYYKVIIIRRILVLTGILFCCLMPLNHSSRIQTLILPGGESTAMRRLIDKYEFMDTLKDFARVGKPMFGTCAGLILLAKELVGYDESHIGVMNIKV